MFMHLYPLFHWVLGVGYDMGIYPIPIPKIPNSYGYLPNTHTQIPDFFGYILNTDTQNTQKY